MNPEPNGIDDILDNCLYLIATKQDTLENCLARYPHLREKLEPLLRLATTVRTVPPALPSPDFKTSLRQKLLQVAEAKQAKQIALTPGLLPAMRQRWAQLSQRGVGVRKALVRTIAVLLLTAIMGSGAVAVSANSLPGDPLYPVKIATERAQLALTFNNNSKAQLHLKLAQKRLGEVETLAATKNSRGITTATTMMNQHLEQAQAFTAGALGKDKETLYLKILELTEQQQAVLQTVLDKVPTQAKSAINRAIGVSQRGHKQAAAALKKIKKAPRPSPPSQIVPPVPGGKEAPPVTPGSPEDTSEELSDSTPSVQSMPKPKIMD